MQHQTGNRSLTNRIVPDRLYEQLKMKFLYFGCRFLTALVEISFLGSCALSVDPQPGQFMTVKAGMEREQVIQTLGSPPQSSAANGKPTLDSWACKPDGQIVAIKMSPGWLIAEYIFTLGIAGLVDAVRYYDLQQRINKCDVHYDPEGKVSQTSSVHGAVVTQ
jgi:hypothetical protein